LECTLSRLGSAGVAWCWAGAAARARLGERSVRSRPEVLAHAGVEALSALLPEATRRSDSSLWLDAVVVRAVPEGLERGLRARGVRVDAVGVDPEGRVLDPLGGVAALAAGDLGYMLSGDEASDAAIGLRILAVASELATAPSPALISAIADTAGLSLRVKPPLVFDLLDRLLLGRRPAEALDLV